MKKVILSILTAFVLVGASAYASEAEDYVYFSMETVTETDYGYEHTLIAEPMKAYESGFYNYEGEFVEFANPAANAADVVDGVLSYYKENGVPMVDGSEYVLGDYDNGGGLFFSAFQISGLNADTPTAIYAGGIYDGLSSYNISENCGVVFRLVFADDYWIWNYYGDLPEEILPTSDELIAAMGDYCEKAATGNVTKAATEAYEEAKEYFFERGEAQNELCTNLKDALKPSSTGGKNKVGVALQTNNLQMRDLNLSGSIKAKLTSDEAITARVIAVIYDGNSPIYIKSEEKSLAKGETAAEFPNISVNYKGKLTVKIFVWNSFAGFKPISDGAAATIN